MYAKSVQREDCTSVLLDDFRSAVSSTVGLPTAMALIGPVQSRTLIGPSPDRLYH